MRITGSHSTVGAMHVATGLMSYAVGQALQDGIERSAQMEQVDRAHAIGQRRYIARVRQRIAEQDAEAEAAAVRLMANRKRLHG